MLVFRCRTVRLIIAAFATFVASAGCSGRDGADVASIGSPAADGGRQSSSDQRVTAEAMVACLAGNSIAAYSSDIGDAVGQVEVLIEDGAEVWQLCDEDGCLGGGGVGLGPREFDAANEVTRAVAEARQAGSTAGTVKPWLIIGGEDMSENWQQCANVSGYQRPAWIQDPTEELQEKRRIADAGTAWAACARRNGHPSTKDPEAPQADDWATEPTAVLPSGITAQQLAALLEVCPTFDSEAQAAADDDLAADPDMAEDEYWALVPAEAVIGFNVPCQDGSAVECDEATWAKYNPLHQLVENQRNAYLEAR